VKRGVSGLVAGLGAVVLVATACTGSTPVAAPTPTPLGGHLLWWDISTQTGAASAMQSLIEGFDAQHPGITIDYVNVPADAARGRIDTAAQAASGAPDVVTLDSVWVADFASRGYLARLDDTAAVDPNDDQFPDLLSTVKYDGRIVALPRSADGTALIYNVAMLKRADLAPPRTWAELTADRLKLTAQGVQTLYAPADSHGLLPWIYGEGGKLVDPEAKTIDISSAAAVAGLSKRLELQATGVAVDDSSANSVDAMRAAFRQGKVAMILDSAAALPSLVGGVATPTLRSIGIALLPAGSVGSSSPLTGTAYAVYAGSHNLDSAYALVHFLDSAASQASLAARLGLLPTRVSAYTQPAVKSDAVIQDFETIVRTGTPLPQVPQNEQLLPPLDDALRRALAGDGSPQKIMDSVAATYSRILADFSIGPPNS
jgi:arabinogalactan oligomer / maltooligosaccharide transport system substrate-binding protein